MISQKRFWATVCKTVGRMLSDRCHVRLPVCPVLSVCLSVTLVYCGQMVGRIKIKHGSRPRPWPHCVRRGPSSPPPKGHSPPIFGRHLRRPNDCMDQDATWYGGRPRPRRLCVRWDMFTVAKRLDGSRWYLARN